MEIDKSIITGMLLGDGSIDKGGQLVCEHSIKQADYLYWKYDKLSHLCASMPRVTKRGKAIRFRTRALFKDLREKWYGSGRKALPKDWDLFIFPETLAIWFMDDGDKKTSKTVRGYYCSDTAMRIATSCFNRKEHRNMIKVIKDLFDIEAAYKREGKYLRLYIPAKDGNSKNFADIIRPFMPDCMRYKLPMFRVDRRGKHGNQVYGHSENGQFIPKFEGAETKQGAMA